MKELPDFELPDLSGHPPAPKLSFAEYERWILDMAAARGPMTKEEAIADFMRNEGRQTEPWPDFGAA